MLNQILAVDIGSSKICALIAQKNENDELKIIGAGISKSNGLKKGIITNIDLASKSIKNAFNDAKRVAGTNINRAIVSISGAYTKSINSNGIVNIPNKEITINEINRVIQTALYNANIPNEYEILHILPYNFKVDDQENIEDPYGMNAGRLEVAVHIITTQKSNLLNLKKAIRSAGIDIKNIVLSGYASSIAVLNEDEKELGVGVIDMGASTSNIVIHIGNSIRYNDFLGVGSNHITNDLSMALHTPLSIAEKIKLEHGSLKNSKSETIEIPVIGDENSTQEVSLEIVYNVIFARVEETLMILAKSIEKSGLKEQIGAGIVLTGGMSKLDGIRELAAAIFDNMPVRIGKPKKIEGMFEGYSDPSFSTAIGLILYGAGEFTQYEIDSNKKLRHRGEEIEKNEIFKSTQESLTDLKDIKKSSEMEELTKLPEEEKDGANNGFTKIFKWIAELFKF